MRHRANQRSKQTGVTLALMTVFLLVGLSSLGVVSVGQHYWEKGRIQKIVDLAALAAARELHGGPPFNLANAVAQQNGLADDETITYTCLVNNGVDPVFETADCSVANAVQASSSRNVAPFFFLGNTDLVVQAQATQAPAISGSIQSSLAVAGLGGLNLELLGGGSLIDSGFGFNVLDFAAELGLTRISDLATTTVSATSAFDAAVAASGVTPAEVASTLVQELSDVLAVSDDVLLGDIIQLSLGEQLQGRLSIRLNDFARALGLNALAGQGIDILDPGVTLSLPLAEPLSPVYQVAGIRNLRVTILEAPQIFVGRKVPGGGIIAQASTSQMQVDLDLLIDGDAGLLQSLSNAVLLGVNTQFSIGLRLNGVGGQATVDDLTCQVPETTNTIDATLTSTLASLEICPCDPEDNPSDLLTVEVLDVLNQNALTGVLGGLLGILLPSDFADVAVQLRKGTGDDLGDPVVVDATGTPTSVQFVGVDFPYSQSVPIDVGGALPNLFGPLDYSVVVAAGSENSLILDVISPTQLLSAVSAALGPALSQVGSLLDDVLLAAGIELNGVELQVDQVDCESVVLSQ